MYLKADGTRYFRGFAEKGSQIGFGTRSRLAQTIVTPAIKSQHRCCKGCFISWLTRAYSGYYPHTVMDFGNASANAMDHRPYNDLPIYRYGSLLNYAKAHGIGRPYSAMLDESINLLQTA